MSETVVGLWIVKASEKVITLGKWIFLQKGKKKAVVVHFYFCLYNVKNHSPAYATGAVKCHSSKTLVFLSGFFQFS